MKVTRGKMRLSFKERLSWWWTSLKWRVTGKDPGRDIPWPFEADGKTPKQ